MRELLGHAQSARFEALRQRLLPGRTYCFVGSSGVGKSTIINALLGAEVQRLGAILLIVDATRGRRSERRAWTPRIVGRRLAWHF